MLIADYFIYAILGVTPSLIWLVYYLNKDNRPEPKKIVLQVFLLGALMGPVAILLQLIFRWISSPTADWASFINTIGQKDNRFFLNIIIFAPLTEEFLKFIVVRWRVLKNPAFDEPFDAMLYLIISALGFAAVENLLYIFLMPELTLGNVLSQTLARFLSATFLHTLASGILGFFLAISWLKFKERKIIFAGGFILVTAIHGFYNYLAWLIDANGFYAFGLMTLIIILGGIVHWQLHNLKNKPSVCKI
jgi:RsiW-degrading membrane proteinase PrsW (M82 family)